MTSEGAIESSCPRGAAPLPCGHEQATRCTVTTEGRCDLDLRRLAEDFVNRLWIPNHLTPAEAAVYALDYFRRTVHAELKLLVVTPALDATAT